MANTKELTIKINGKENVDKLGESLGKVDVKMKDMSVSAKDVADTYKKDFREVMEFMVLQMSKIGAIITELNTHVEQIIDKNVEAGEKLAESIDKAVDSGTSSAEKAVTSTSSFAESLLNIITNGIKEQSTVLEEQLNKNKELTESITEENLKVIKTKYEENGKKIGLVNLKVHKENVNAHIGELTRLKEELEKHVADTEAQYNLVTLFYDKDSEEFKKAQAEKIAELEKLQKRITEINAEIKEQNKNYLGVWKQQHSEIKTKLDELSNQSGDGKIKDFLDNNTLGFVKFVENFGQGIQELKTGFDTIAAAEKKALDKKYEQKIEKLDKELERVNAEVAKHQQEKAQLEKEQAEAQAKADKYREERKKIADAFGIEIEENKKQSPETDDKTASLELSEKDNQEEEKAKTDEGIIPVKEATKEEINAANDRLAELERLAAAEEEIVKNKATDIANSNNRIIESERSVLLEKTRIENEQQKLKEEKDKKQAELEEKTRKRKEKLEKLEKIKAKAQIIIEIANATKDVAAGVAKAWAKGPILGPPLAALVAIQGAIQLGIMSQQLKYFANGGLLNGKRHSQGGMRIEGTNIEVEGGEYVVNRESTDKNLGLVRYINSQRRELTANDMTTFFSKASQGYEPPFRRQFEDGGQMPVISDINNNDNDMLLDAIKSIKFEPKVAVTDIIHAQDDVTQVDGWAGI